MKILPAERRTRPMFTLMTFNPEATHRRKILLLTLLTFAALC